MLISNARAKEIKERCEAATEGPWIGDRYDGTAKYEIVQWQGTQEDYEELMLNLSRPSCCRNNAPLADEAYHYGTVVLKIDHKDATSGFLSDNDEADEGFVIHSRADLPDLLIDREERVKLMAEAGELLAMIRSCLASGEQLTGKEDRRVLTLIVTLRGESDAA